MDAEKECKVKMCNHKCFVRHQLKNLVKMHVKVILHCRSTQILMIVSVCTLNQMYNVLT